MSNFPHPERSFQKETGKETSLKILEEKKINAGSFGIIFDTLVEIGGHKKRFIVKKYYRTINETDSPEQHAANAFENYSLAKKAGLKVFPTFRLGDDKQSILMTSGFLGDKICIGSNNFFPTVETFGQPLIREIEGLDQFLASVFSEGLKALKAELLVYTDNLFFLVSKNAPTKVDFVFGDFDNLLKGDLTFHSGFRNMQNLKVALNAFSEINMTPPYRKIFLEKLDYHFNQAMAKIQSIVDTKNSG